MASAGQGFLSKKERKGLHPDRRDRIVGSKKMEDDQDTIVGEHEGVPRQDDAPAVEQAIAAAKDDTPAKEVLA